MLHLECQPQGAQRQSSYFGFYSTKMDPDPKTEKNYFFHILCCSVIGIFIKMFSNGHFPSKWPSKLIVLKQQLRQQHAINSVTCSEQHKNLNVLFTSSTSLCFLLASSSTKYYFYIVNSSTKYIYYASI